MKALRAVWRELAVFLGWSCPAEVEEGYPTTLDEYRERKRVNEELAAIARRRVRELGR